MAIVEPSGLIETMRLNSNGRGCSIKLEICSNESVIWVMTASHDVIPVHQARTYIHLFKIGLLWLQS